MSLRAAKTLAAVAAGAAHHTVAFDGGDVPAALASEVVEDDAAAHDVRALVPELLKRALRRDATAMAALRARDEMARRALAIGARLARDPAVRRSAVRRCRVASGKERELIAEAVAKLSAELEELRREVARDRDDPRRFEAAPGRERAGDPFGRLGDALLAAALVAAPIVYVAAVTREPASKRARAAGLVAAAGLAAILSGALGERARE